MKYDQHFLTNKKIISIIEKNLDFINEKTVVEIGAGTGAITPIIKKRAKKLIIIEIDEELIPGIKKIHEKVILGNAITKIGHIKYDCIVSNLPYGITEPLFKKLLREPKEMLLLLGNNFGRLLSLETKLGMAIKEAWNINIITEVNKESFTPKPHTKSLLIKFEPKNKESIILELYNQHDKKVKNAIINHYCRQGLTKREAKDLLTGAVI